MEELEKVAESERIDTKDRRWPKAANWLTRRLNEVEPNLLDAGIRFHFARDDGRRLTVVKEDHGEGAGNADDTDGTDGIVRTFDVTQPTEEAK